MQKRIISDKGLQETYEVLIRKVCLIEMLTCERLARTCTWCMNKHNLTLLAVHLRYSLLKKLGT